jgi:hypothetical protein
MLESCVLGTSLQSQDRVWESADQAARRQLGHNDAAHGISALTAVTDMLAAQLSHYLTSSISLGRHSLVKKGSSGL